jgi:Flp pilus assembly protein TadG
MGTRSSAPNSKIRIRGQALVMVTLALVAMVGLLGLAVDLGWSFYVRKSAQAATDAAALAAVHTAYDAIGGGGTYTACGATEPDCVVANAPTPCGAGLSGNLAQGCTFAAQNGFTEGGNNNRQNVTMQAQVGGPFITATGPVATYYWVTARARENIPQLFSAILGNTMGTSGAKSTAAVIDMVVDGALILLNRQYDRARFGNSDIYGMNLMVQANDNQGQYALQTAGNIRMSSTCNGSSLGAGHCLEGNKAAHAGRNQGGGTIYTLPAGTTIRGNGGYSLGGSSQWISTPTNGGSGSFDDPTAVAQLPQPPPPTGLGNYEYELGEILGTDDPDNPLVLPPGNYYAITTDKKTGVTTATGGPLLINGHVEFSAGAFSDYVFYGGIQAMGGGSHSVTFGPGRHVFAGATPTNSGPGSLLLGSNNFNIKDKTMGFGAPGDLGELFIMTDPTYPGLQVPQRVADYQATATDSTRLQFGNADFKTGNSSSNLINLHGLNKGQQASLPGELQPYAPFLYWQDRRNSFVSHDQYGNPDISCAGATLDNPCTNTLSQPDSPGLLIQASPQVHLYGTIYQPRGAWTVLQGGGGYNGPLQLITGALLVQGNSNVNLTAPVQPFTIRMVALIE